MDAERRKDAIESLHDGCDYYIAIAEDFDKLRGDMSMQDFLYMASTNLAYKCKEWSGTALDHCVCYFDDALEKIENAIDTLPTSTTTEAVDVLEGQLDSILNSFKELQYDLRRVYELEDVVRAHLQAMDDDERPRTVDETVWWTSADHPNRFVDGVESSVHALSRSMAHNMLCLISPWILGIMRGAMRSLESPQSPPPPADVHTYLR
jgi:hypothetical protein